ncbi:MAG: Rieske (2Fe-2S) protein [Chthonomonadales bacterium]
MIAAESRPITQATDLQSNLGPISQIPQGEGRNFWVGPLRIAVFHTRRGEVFASQAECPHRIGPLADGLMGENSLVCPFHGWKFDLATGKTENGECGLEVYPVELNKAGEILITVPVV